MYLFFRNPKNNSCLIVNSCFFSAETMCLTLFLRLAIFRLLVQSLNIQCALSENESPDTTGCGACVSLKVPSASTQCSLTVIVVQQAFQCVSRCCEPTQHYCIRTGASILVSAAIRNPASMSVHSCQCQRGFGCYERNTFVEMPFCS